MKNTLLIASACMLCAFALLPQVKWTGQSPLQHVLASLGEAPPKHHRPASTPEQVQQGYDIVHQGYASKGPKGKRSKYVSKFYVCTNCHNTQIEDPDLRRSDPEARLAFAQQKGLPFLQGTTFYGIVNRESWYNDDYVKKYGMLVKPANADLVEAIQLCAQECSQGRTLETWEVDAILAYFWSIQYKLEDLKLAEADFKRLEEAQAASFEETRNWLKSYYLQKSPATFADAPADKQKGYGMVGSAANGKILYERACQQCHKPHGVSEFLMDTTRFTMKFLQKNIAENSRFSLYQIVRYGTYASAGHRPYMPHYTLERMSHQQLEDLRAYIFEDREQ